MAPVQTHYVPYFTIRQGDRLVYAVCGVMVDVKAEHSNEPTCPDCQEWIARDAAARDDEDDEMVGL